VKFARRDAVRGDHENGIVAGNGAHHFRPFGAIEGYRDRTGVTRRGLQYDEVLRAPHVLQELAGEQLELRSGLTAHFAIALRCLDQPKIPNVSRQRHLRGVDTDRSQECGKVLLSVDRMSADQFENLSLPITLGHWRMVSKSATRAFNMAFTCAGPVPPGISRDFMPSRGSRSVASTCAMAGVNSGANACKLSAFHS